MATYALRLENNTDTAARVRMADVLALPPGTEPLTSRSALRPDGGGSVTVVAGSMSVKVAPFLAWVDGGVSVVQSGYPFVHDAEVTLAIAAGHATLARVDVVAGVVRDNAFDSSGQVLAAVQVIQGTPGSGAPSLPANAVALREINVPAGLSAGNGGLTSGNLGLDRRSYIGGWQAYTPVASSETGTMTSTATGRFTQIGKTVHYSVVVQITSVNSAGGTVRFTLPVPPSADTATVFGYGRENAATGAMLMVLFQNGMGGALRYDNASAIAAGRQISVSGTYEAA